MEIGQRVRFSATLTRVNHYSSPGRLVRREWMRVKVDRPTHGSLVGLRTCSNGRMVREDTDGGGVYTFYHPVESLRTALVATHLRRKFLIVPMDALEVVA